MTKQPFKQYKKCILILVDGARPDIMTKEVMKGNLPNIQNHFVKNGTQKNMLTCFPSTTGPAYLPYLTGCYPGTCNIPGVRWFDKINYAKKGWSYKSFRSYCGFETSWFDKDLIPQIKTVWEIFKKSKNIIGGVTKGIQKKNNITRTTRSHYYYYSHLTDRWAFIDQVASEKLLAEVNKNDFEFIFTVFPGVDEYSHRSSPFHERTIQTYAKVDSYLGELITLLQKKNIYNDTLLIIVSDHGLSETTKHFDVGPWLNNEKKIKTFYYTNIFKFRFKAATMVSGNGMCHIYLKGQNGWNYRTPFEELSSTSLILDELRLRPEVALVVTQGANKAIHFQNKSGHSWFTYDNKTGLIWYDFENVDPLNLFTKSSQELKTGFNFEQSLQVTWNSQTPDIFMQMHQLFTSPRTGDIIISANKGFDFRVKYEHPIHKASHGGILPEHMRVPLYMNHPIEETYIRSVDIFPTLLKLMGKDVPKGIDGKCLV